MYIQDYNVCFDWKILVTIVSDRQRLVTCPDRGVIRDTDGNVEV